MNPELWTADGLRAAGVRSEAIVTMFAGKPRGAFVVTASGGIARATGSRRPPPSATSLRPEAPRAAAARSLPTLASRPFGRDTWHLESHLVGISRAREHLIAAQLTRDGFGTLLLTGVVRGDRTPGGLSGGDVAARLDSIRELAAAGERLRASQYDDESAPARDPRLALLLRIDSSGGDAVEGQAIIRMLRRFSEETGPVIAYVEGKACSMGCAIAVAADYVVADPASSWLVHPPQGGSREDRAHFDEVIFQLELDRTLLDAKTLDEWWRAELRFEAATAVERGFADQVGGLTEARAVARGAESLSRVPRTFRQQVLAERRQEALERQRGW